MSDYARTVTGTVEVAFVALVVLGGDVASSTTAPMLWPTGRE
jgi:hypothetical protein